MKLKNLLTVIAACAVAMPAFTKAEEDTPLSKEMEKLSKALKLMAQKKEGHKKFKTED